MAELRFREKRALEDFLEMGGGYVLNFNDRTFSEFFQDFDINIEDARYSDGNSGSKANRMRCFWTIESDHAVGQILEELIKYAESYRPDHQGADECRIIANRLLNANSFPVTTPAHSNQHQQNMTVSLKSNGPIEMFFSYAHRDEVLMDQIRTQLVVRERLGQIAKWHDRMIPPGDEWKTSIDQRIRDASIFLLFMSPDFLASRYCYEIEGDIALRRHREGSAKVIPIVLRACDWTETPFGDLQGLPEDGKPFNQWPDKDQASLDIARSIMAMIR